MGFSLRSKSPFYKSSYNSSKNSHNLSASNDFTHSSYTGDDEESPLIKQYPIISSDDHSYDFYNVHPMTNPSIHGDVIVKIDPADETITAINNNNNMNDPSSSRDTGIGSPLWKGSPEEFSFPRPNNENKDDEESSFGSGRTRLGPQLDPSTKLIGQFLDQQWAQGSMSLDMDMDMDELRQNQHQHQPRHQQQRSQAGLRPPLPPDSNWSRNLSDIPSSFTNNNSNSNSNNDGSKEIRVSFHDSLTSELVRRPSSMYSNVNDDSSSCNSSMSGDDETNYDGTHPHKLEHNHSEEMLIRSRSIRTNTNTNASFQRMTSNLSKTKSRLLDPHSTNLEQRSGTIPRSGQLNMRSGLLGTKMSIYDDDGDEDSYIGDDLPEEFTKPKISILFILEWVSLIAILGALICSLIIPVLREKTLWDLELWKWEVLILVIICGRLVSGWGIRILVFCIERNFILRKRVLYFVYGLKIAVQNVIWLGLVLITWCIMFDNKVLKESKSKNPLEKVTQLLIVGEIGATLWLLKTLLVKVLASDFHVKAFFDRIQESLFNQFVIETLSAPPYIDFQHGQDDDVQSLQNAGLDLGGPPSMISRNKSGRSSILHRTTTDAKNIGSNTTPYKSPIGQSTRLSEPNSKKYDEGITIDHLHRLNQNNVSAWNMKRLMRIIRKGALTTLDEHLVDAPTQEDESQTCIRSEVEAKAAARKIFRNVAKPRSRYIYLEDIMRFMREDEAVKTMHLFEGAIENERINKKSLKNWVVYAFRERRSLALTLSDTKSAVHKLHKMVNVIVCIIIIIIGLTLLGIITSQSLLFLSSQVVLVAFVFGNTCKNIFECIIFLFVIHPYDVGDRCEIDAIQMVVEEINILTTIFLRWDNQKITYPNYVLLTKPIHNLYRSPDMLDAIDLCFHIATPAEKIALIRQRITSYIENKKEHWYPEPMIILKDAEGLHMLRITIWVTHRMNFQDVGERWVRRALFVEECIKIMREQDIEFRLYPINVNVTSIPPLNYPQVVPASNRNLPRSESGKDIHHS